MTHRTHSKRDITLAVFLKGLYIGQGLELAMPPLYEVTEHPSINQPGSSTMSWCPDFLCALGMTD